jgi:hypothetical protein
VIGENPAKAGVRELCRALILRSRIGRRLDFEFQTHSLSFLPLLPAVGIGATLAPAGLSGPAGSIDLDFTGLGFIITSLAAGFRCRHVG